MLLEKKVVQNIKTFNLFKILKKFVNLVVGYWKSIAVGLSKEPIYCIKDF